MILQVTFMKVDSFVPMHRIGLTFLAPLDVVIRRDPLRTRQPDLMFISNARRYIIGRQVIEGGPDLVVEILSPSNTRRELQEKL
jgi:Uma2 family endonuclease